MRSFLWAVPVSALVLASVGCTTGQRVKYDVNGDAVAVEAPTYEPAANTTPAQTPVQQVVTNPEPEPAATPAPAPEPAAAPAPVAKKPAAKPKAAKPAATAAGKTYVVEKGDTLQKISMKVYGTTRKWKKIQQANNLKGDLIRVGQKLVIPELK